MVPVEDAAGGAAAVAHHQTEGAPHQHADQIADIEADGAHEQAQLADDAAEVQAADGQDQGGPDQEDLVGRLGGGDDVIPQGLVIDFFQNGLEAVGEELHGAQGQLVADGQDLMDHIHHPKEPQQVVHRPAPEEVQPLQDGEGVRPEDAGQGAQDEYDAAADEL